jgi:hypothetical protein
MNLQKKFYAMYVGMFLIHLDANFHSHSNNCPLAYVTTPKVKKNYVCSK